MMLLAALLIFGATVILPILSLLRILRQQAEIDQLRGRVDVLERQPMASQPSASPEAPTPSPEPFAPPPFPPSPSPLPPALDLEERIGGRWLQHAGLIVLLLGVAFFLRYAFEREWLSPVVRVALGGVAGLALVGGGLRMSRPYRTYGLLLAGGGLAVLYLSVYAGLNLYELLPAQLAFGLLVAITIAGAWLADRTGAVGLAFFAVCGGYATPFLVGGDTDAQRTLFTYVALLVTAITVLAHRRSWPWLNVVSLLLTALVVLSWAATYYTPEKYLRTELFLTFYCAMFVNVIRKTWSTRREDAPLVVCLLLAPLSYHVWSVIALAPHGVAFLTYMIGVTLVATLAGVHYGSSLLRAVAWLAIAVPMAAWIEDNHFRSWLVATIVTVAGVYAVHLATQIRGVLLNEDLDLFDVALVHANGIGLFAALNEVLTDTLTTPQLAALAVVLAAGNAGIWAAMRRVVPNGALHWLGVAITLVAVAVWLQLGGPWAIVAWATEGAIVFWLATRFGREWIRLAGWALLGLALYRWINADVQATPASFVVIANARAVTGIYLVAALYLAAWLQHRLPDAAAEARRHERAVVLVAASLVTLVVMSPEIMSFWATRGDAQDAFVAREMMLSASWVLYGAILVLAGMRYLYAPIRYFAIGLLVVALGKVFLVDLQTLGGIYRVAGFLVIGLILLVVSFLYQRTRMQPEP
jgi:uncharacterized membrane protein